MPMIQAPINSSTLALTSVLSAVITYAFCRSNEIPSGASAIIASVVGIALYVIGVIPIGLLVIVGIGILLAIAKSLYKSKPPGE